MEIPNLDKETLEAIFKGHAASLEEDPTTTPTTPLSFPSKDQTIGFKLPIGMEGGLANFGEMMQHNSDQMHAIPLPQEILSKIATMAQAVGLDTSLFPKAEPHCNCPHCQMARAIHQNSEIEDEQKTEGKEEVVTDEDLFFQEWDIQQKNDQLYRITNVLDSQEHYDVFLGEPIGCTCGEKNCEHIRAVLRS